MKNYNSMPARATIPYCCSSCSRCFVVFGTVVAGEILCSCGAPLWQRPLLRGRYELWPSAPDEDRPTDPCDAPTPKESDLGYGASHGHDASHGGPTGPGDAPADVTESARGR
jgi:hypothetical protein